MPQSPQPNRDYSSERKFPRIGSQTARIGGALLKGVGGVFKEITKPAAPRGGDVPEDEDVRYGVLSSGQIELDKAISRVRSSSLSPKEKKIAEADLLVRGTQNLTGTRVTKEKVAAVAKELEGLVGKSAAAEVRRVVDRLFEGGRERTGADIEKAIRMHTKNLHGWQEEAASRRLAGLDQKGKPLRKNNVLFHEDIARVAANVGSRGGKYSAQKFEKPFYPIKNRSSGNGARPESRPVKRTVGLIEGLFGGARRPNNNTNSNNK